MKRSTIFVSDKLKDVTLQMLQVPSRMSRKIQEQLVGMDGYKDMTMDAQESVSSFLIRALALWAKSLLSGEPPTRETLEIFSEHGRQRANEGIPIQSLMRGFSISMREIWQAYLELIDDNDDEDLEREVLFNVSGYLFRYFDEVSEESIKAFLDEQIRSARWQEQLHQRLRYILFHSPQDESGFRRVLTALGLDHTIPRVAMALEVSINSETLISREEEIDRLILLVARTFKVASHTLIRAWHRDRLIVWLPCAHGDAITHCDQVYTENAASFLVSAPQVKQIGLGMMNYALKGWACSANEALKACEYALPNGSSPQSIRRYSSILIEDGIRNCDNIMRYLVALLERLANEPELLLTLETYLSLGRRRSHTAKNLGIHPNTLDYRLGRVENLLSASLDDTDWVSKLDLAIRLRSYSQGGRGSLKFP